MDLSFDTLEVCTRSDSGSPRFVPSRSILGRYSVVHMLCERSAHRRLQDCVLLSVAVFREATRAACASPRSRKAGSLGALLSGRREEPAVAHPS